MVIRLIKRLIKNQEVFSGASTKKARRSDATKLDLLYANAKDLIQNGKIYIRVAFSSLVSFHHLTVCWAADYINIYIFAEPYIMPFSLQSVLAGVSIFGGLWRGYI